MVELLFLITLAFSSGMLAFLGPCGIAMLPAYISYVFGRDDEKKKSTKFSGVTKGLLFGLIASLGIITIYLLMGSVFSLGGTFIKPYVPFMGLLIGAMFIVIGLLVFLERFPTFSFMSRNPFMRKKAGKGSFYIFGAGYGIAQMSCTLPIFLVVVFEALALGNLINGMIVFLAYALGMSLGMTLVTVGSFTSRAIVQRYIGIIVPHIKKIMAIVLIAAGLYQIYFEVAINQALILLGI